MLRILNAKIRTDDDAAAAMFGAGWQADSSPMQIVQSGNVVSISRREEGGRYRRLDQLVDATVDFNGKVWRVDGYSKTLLDDVGLRGDAAKVKLTVTGVDGCPGCH